MYMSYQKKMHDWLHRYPAIEDLRTKAKKKIPNVAWEYLETGTGREELLQKNLDSFTEIELTPKFCKGSFTPDITTSLLGTSYDAPFGIAPIGLQGLMWPKAEIYLAQAAARANIPVCLSTVATETPETVGPHAGKMGWFQLYPPREPELRATLLKRALDAGYETLVVTVDIPTPSRRERTKRAGLSTPPKITPSFIWQGITHPSWTIGTLKNGLPRLKTIEAYSDFKDMMSVGNFVQGQLGGNISWEYLKEVRDLWKGPMIIKGLLHPEDAIESVKIGAEGIVVSNHGARQFDGAPTSIAALPDIVDAVKGQTAIIMDSGIRNGLDILRAISLGADFVLLGRAFMYGVAALGKLGGDHTIEILRSDLKNNMAQLGIASLSEIQ